MKANKAPEKLYLHSTANGNVGASWLTFPLTNEDIEYIRHDAFMKKAKEAFCKAKCNDKPPRSTCTSLGTCREYDNFIKYMKGE